jgi:hypothetical protein
MFVMELVAAPAAPAAAEGAPAPAPTYAARVYSFDALHKVLTVAGEAGKLRELQEIIQGAFTLAPAPLCA